MLTRKLGLLEKSEASCCGVTLSQCHAVVEIGRVGSISVNNLAGILGLDKSTMSRTVNNLVEQGLVTRETDPEDRRYLSIGLTDQGRQLFVNIESGMEQFYQDAFKAIPPEKREQVLESLEILVKSLPNKCC
ncbi:MarR family winged helix-turn-helix transcriptional regulator [Pelotomaculum propionicicum]|uniref:Multidrug resistance operon repressor n=1 Tax=Pelotomaculum propionicicum TaxID=258475 RepID=A0A4Y7RT38_9FIRM|nr:MarR family winged helix-turn-helix transcriptional regulator [Pelotomaculum propionicicum]TEB12184.1 Multidrug resistance operon repressor [Pelotomaculum propionicicum]